MRLRKHYKLYELIFEPGIWRIAFRELNKDTRSLHFEVAASTMNECLRPCAGVISRGSGETKFPVACEVYHFQLENMLVSFQGREMYFVSGHHK